MVNRASPVAERNWVGCRFGGVIRASNEKALSYTPPAAAGGSGRFVQAPKRNGASLAADPTLTGVWASEEALDAWRLEHRSRKSGCRHRPALAPAPDPLSGRTVRRLSQPFGGFRDRFRRSAPGDDPVCALALQARQHRPLKARPVRLRTVAVSMVGASVGPGGSPVLLPPPRRPRRRVEAVPKSLLRRRPFGLCLGRANPRLDVWKMRRAGESRNGQLGDFSTFVDFRGGQGWISQRPVAGYPLSRPASRWASNRSRSALSLMKPAASCWS